MSRDEEEVTRSLMAYIIRTDATVTMKTSSVQTRDMDTRVNTGHLCVNVFSSSALRLQLTQPVLLDRTRAPPTRTLSVMMKLQEAMRAKNRMMNTHLRIVFSLITWTDGSSEVTKPGVHR